MCFSRVKDEKVGEGTYAVVYKGNLFHEYDGFQA